MPVITETFPGAPGGSNLAIPQHELDDTEARIIQDGLIDRPGETRRRGPLTAVAGMAALTRKGSGLVATLTPQGRDRYAVLTGTSTTGFLDVFSSDLSAIVSLAWPYALPADPVTSLADRHRLTDIKPGLKGGTLIGTSSAYDADSPEQAIGFWRGGTKATFTGTVTCARGSAAMTGTGFTAGVDAGMFVFANTDEPYTAALIGVVSSVNSDTSLTLDAVSPYAITAKTATIQSLRGLAPKVAKGRINAATDSTQVNGGSTKFLSQALNVGTWNIYKQSDLTFIGKVTSVQSEIALTLAANAAQAVADEEYVALRADSDYSIINTANVNKVGFLNAVHAERQWYANLGAQFEKTSRVWFSDTADPEALDLSNDGDWIEVTSTAQVNEPIRMLMPAYNSLLVFKESETFAIYGNSPSQFAVKKVFDDGLFAGMSVQAYGGGAIWAGRDGIHYFDGVQVNNLSQPKLGDVWRNSVRSVDPSRYRMWSMLVRDHYFLFIEDIDPTVAIVKGNVSVTPGRWTVVINMNSRAFTFFTNTDIRGAVKLPQSNSRSVWFLVNNSTIGKIMDADALFDSEGVDTVTCVGSAIGPDFFFESKKFNAGDALRLKRFKQLGMHYLVQGAAIKCDTVMGLNNVGQTLTSTFPPSGYTWDSLAAAVGTWNNLKNEFATWADIINSVYLPKRVKFMKRSQHLSFRLWQASAAVTRLRIGPYQIIYKLLRPGRI